LSAEAARPQRPPAGFAERPMVTLPNAERRTVFTGIGVVAPTGNDAAAWWKAAQAGKSGIDRITHFDTDKYATKLAGEVKDFDAGDFIERRLQVQTDRWTHMALAATEMAFADAEFEPFELDPYSLSVITASSSGGNEFGQKEIEALWAKGPGFVGAYQSIAWFYAATSGQISIRHNLMGPCGVVVAEGAGGLEAMQHSRRTIRRGVDAVVSGGLEAPIGPYALTCQMGNGLLSTEEDPKAAYRPFDKAANGYVPGEGGAILLMESAESAGERGAPQVYGEVAGYGATNDAYHHSQPAPDGSQLARAIRIAIDDAGVDPEEVDVIFADAAGVPEADAAEAAAIEQALGDHGKKVPVTAPKSGVGRLYAGGSSLDVAAALLALRDGSIPPTVNLDDPADGCDLNFVTGAAQKGDLNTALVLARGFGGFNGALVVRSAA
jgi:3-oxoacyl-(acyl-carrier-protein) synthase